jgi:hypothetical protein
MISDGRPPQVRARARIVRAWLMGLDTVWAQANVCCVVKGLVSYTAAATVSINSDYYYCHYYYYYYYYLQYCLVAVIVVESSSSGSSTSNSFFVVVEAITVL